MLVLAPSPESKGGISSVIAVYRDYGLFSAGDVDLICTYVDGNWLAKAHVALRALGHVAIQLVAGRVGCVHAHVATGASFWRKLVFMVLAAAGGRPFVFHLHAGGFADFYDTSLGGFGRWTARWLFRKAARVVVLSPEWSRWLQSTEPAARVTVIPNPVLAGTAGENRSAQSAVLFLGRLGQKKGTVDLIRAFESVVRCFPGAILYLAGDGDAEGTRAQAAALGIEQNIRILGWVRGEKKSELMSRASIFVLPSYFEGLPMSVLEAMAWGIPVVTTRVGGIPFAVTHEVEGLLIRPGDTEALAGALVRLLGDPELRSAMGRAGRARARNQFSAEAILPQVRRLYWDVLPPLGNRSSEHA